MLAEYQDILARGAFGNYRTLLQDVSLSPMMGRYLSHLRNRKKEGTLEPAENYAREVMQLFSIGLLAVLSRRHAIFILIGIEMMLAAANLNFIAFWRFAPPPHPPTGVMIAIFSIAISAAEAAVGLAMIIAVYRHYRTTNVDQYDRLKG